MTALPADTIRRYLDEHDGREDVRVEQLLTTWQLDSWTAREKDEIARGLDAAGVHTEPALEQLDRSDPVLVYLAATNGDHAGTEAPPWGFVDDVSDTGPSHSHTGER